MTTLTDWLLACIADDEAVACAAQIDSGLIDASVRVHDAAQGRAADAAHIARHDPARVLAECEAKRLIVERAIRASQAFDQSINPTTSGVAMTMDLVLVDLALPYADRAGYRPEWKP